MPNSALRSSRRVVLLVPFVLVMIGIGGLARGQEDAGAPDAGVVDAGVESPPLAPPAEREGDARISMNELRLRAGDVPWYQRAISGVGLFVMVALAWAISTNRR